MKLLDILDILNVADNIELRSLVVGFTAEHILTCVQNVDYPAIDSILGSETPDEILSSQIYKLLGYYNESHGVGMFMSPSPEEYESDVKYLACQLDVEYDSLKPVIDDFTKKYIRSKGFNLKEDFYTKY